MSRPLVFVARLIPEKALQIIHDNCDAEVWDGELPPPYEVIRERAAQADGLLTLFTDQVDDELLSHALRLQVVSNMAVGYDNVDVEAATRHGVLVTNTPGVLTETTADLAFALLMATARRVVEGDRHTRHGKWKTWGPMILLGQDVHGATLGLIGLGRIGWEMAKRARGFSMRVLYYDVHRRPELEREGELEFAEFDTVLQEADFVSIHTPLNEETYHLVGAREFGLMKPTAVFVNSSRGPLVDQAALYDALSTGKIFAAGIDVTDPEPVAGDDPLLQLDNLVITPHIASASVATRTRMAVLAAENLVAALYGERPRFLVNPEALGRKK